MLPHRQRRESRPPAWQIRAYSWTKSGAQDHGEDVCLPGPASAEAVTDGATWYRIVPHGRGA